MMVSQTVSSNSLISNKNYHINANTILSSPGRWSEAGRVLLLPPAGGDGHLCGGRQRVRAAGGHLPLPHDHPALRGFTGGDVTENEGLPY